MDCSKSSVSSFRKRIDHFFALHQCRWLTIVSIHCMYRCSSVDIHQCGIRHITCCMFEWRSVFCNQFFKGFVAHFRLICTKTNMYNQVQSDRRCSKLKDLNISVTQQVALLWQTDRPQRNIAKSNLKASFEITELCLECKKQMDTRKDFCANVGQFSRLM